MIGLLLRSAARLKRAGPSGEASFLRDQYDLQAHLFSPRHEWCTKLPVTRDDVYMSTSADMQGNVRTTLGKPHNHSNTLEFRVRG